MPLRGARPVIEAAAAGGGVTLQLARDRAWRPSKLAGDGVDPGAFGHFDRNILALGECQITPDRRLR